MMENYGPVVEEQQQHSQGFISDHLDNLPLALGFSDISLSALLDPPQLPDHRDRLVARRGRDRKKKQISSVSSDSLGDYCSVEVPDDPYTEEVIEHPKKLRNPTAQTHSLTEKRRRDKIKAKMKVLQGLIPNSEKLDRASLLEKVISRIKTLQWQLQFMQGMKSYQYLPPPFQYSTGATQLAPFGPQIPSNMGFGTGPNATMPTIHPHFGLGIPHCSSTLPFWSSPNYGPVQFQPPNNIPYFQQHLINSSHANTTVPTSWFP